MFSRVLSFKKIFLTKYKMADTTLASEVAKLTSCGKKIPSTPPEAKLGSRRGVNGRQTTAKQQRVCNDQHYSAEEAA